MVVLFFVAGCLFCFFLGGGYFFFLFFLWGGGCLSLLLFLGEGFSVVVFFFFCYLYWSGLLKHNDSDYYVRLFVTYFNNQPLLYALNVGFLAR